jgi:hypothetical protein
VAELLRALRLTNGRIDPEHLVIEALAGASEQMPHECVEALRLMLLGEHEWPRFWPDETRRILTTALRGQSKEAQQAADALVQDLGKRGRFEFRDLASGAR